MIKSLMQKAVGKATAIKYTGASLLQTAATMLAGIVIIKFVKPEEIGLWNSLMIVSSYVPFLRMGIISGLNRELPFLMGMGKKDDAEKYASAALWYIMVIIIFVLICTVSATIYMFAVNLSTEYYLGALGVGIIISTQIYTDYLGSTYRSQNAFLKLSKVYLIQFFIILASIPIVYLYNYTGLVVYNVTVAVSLTILMHLTRPIKVKPLKSIPTLYNLGKTGLPLFAIGYMKSIARSFPKLVLLSSGGVLAVGLFAPANAVKNAVTTLPGILARYFYPRLSYSYGKFGDKKLLWDKCWKLTTAILVFGLLLSLIGWPLLDYAIHKFFPLYTEGILPAQIIMISAAFQGSMISINALASVKAFKAYSIFSAHQLITFSFFPWVLTFYFTPILAVSLGILIAQILQFILGNYTLYIVLKKS